MRGAASDRLESSRADASTCSNSLVIGQSALAFLLQRPTGGERKEAMLAVVQSLSENLSEDRASIVNRAVEVDGRKEARSVRPKRRNYRRHSRNPLLQVGLGWGSLAPVLACCFLASALFMARRWVPVEMYAGVGGVGAEVGAAVVKSQSGRGAPWADCTNGMVRV